MMKTSKPYQASTRDEKDAKQLADFMLFTQSNCILRLSSELFKDRISLSQFFLLTYLVDQEGLSMSAIAGTMGHTTAATTGMVDKLDELGLTQRKQSISDRRRVLVQITQKGVDFVLAKSKTFAADLAESMVNEDARDILSDLRSLIDKPSKQAKTSQTPAKTIIHHTS